MTPYDKSNPIDFNRIWSMGQPGPEPACWSWPVSDEVVRLLQRWSEPAGEMDWAEHALLMLEAVRLYDQRRCAICGLLGNEIEDHDHETGLVRGWLCVGCNVREGRTGGTDNVFGRYRSRYPYMILGIREPYSGYGWRDGRPVGVAHWPPTPADEIDQWKNHPFRGVL